ncbi:MAG: hypothetical protein DMF57_15125 [Acidobacteria bacterium]|nr:MAG: hypothetical protein DMF57_15125 [Acidobacteriota bacterium]
MCSLSRATRLRKRKRTRASRSRFSTSARPSCRNGESVSILSRRGDWVEVRTVGGSGWAHAADLAGANAATSQEKNPTARFRLAPSPVTSPGAKGTIYIEADVNTDGDVTATHVITDTTNRPELAGRNAAALEQAKFYPIVQRGEKKPFKYYYRVDY